MQPAELGLIVSKIALLEMVVADMLADDAMTKPAPLAALERFEKCLRERTDKKARTFPDKPEAKLAALIGMNTFDDFFDRVRGLIQAKELDRRS
jgi:hypothetical protein